MLLLAVVQICEGLFYDIILQSGLLEVVIHLFAPSLLCISVTTHGGS